MNEPGLAAMAAQANEADKVDARVALRERIEAARKRRADVDEVEETKALGVEAEVQELLATLEEKRGKHAVRRIDTVGGPVVLVRGVDAAYKRFKRHLEKTKDKPTDEAEQMLFLRPCVAYPKSVDTFLDDAPGALDPLCIEAMKLHGLKMYEDAEK